MNQSIWEHLQNGMPFTLFAVVLGMLAVGVAFVAMVVSSTAKAKRTAVGVAGFAFFLAVLPIGIGVVGQRIGLSRVDAALTHAPSEIRAELRAQGAEEAFGSVVVGGACSAVPFLLALVALGIALGKPRAEDTANA